MSDKVEHYVSYSAQPAEGHRGQKISVIISSFIGDVKVHSNWAGEEEEAVVRRVIPQLKKQNVKRLKILIEALNYENEVTTFLGRDE